MQDFPEKASEYFNNGYSCSEAIIQSAYELNIINEKFDIRLLNAIASPFSGGMGGTGCLCGAVSGAQIVLGIIAGRKDPKTDSHDIKNLSRELVEKFKAKRKATCCKVLSAPYKGNPVARKQNCTELVKEAAEILEKILAEHLVSK